MCGHPSGRGHGDQGLVEARAPGVVFGGRARTLRLRLAEQRERRATVCLLLIGRRNNGGSRAAPSTELWSRASRRDDDGYPAGVRVRWLRMHCVIAVALAVSRAVLAVIAIAATV